MASCNITSFSTSSVTANISGLSNYWDDRYYENAYITCNGQTSAPVYPPAEGSPTAFGYSTPSMTRTGTYTSGTFVVDAYVVATNGETYPAGSASFYIAPPDPDPTRPNNFTGFDWMFTGNPMPTYLGSPSPCSASLWNQFTARINSFRAYKSLSQYTFTPATQGANSLALQQQQARAAISNMSPPTSLPVVAVAGGPVRILKGLATSLNSIP